MEIKCEYSEKEVGAMVLEVHRKRFFLPDGMEWYCISKTYGGAEVIAIKAKEAKPQIEEIKSE